MSQVAQIKAKAQLTLSDVREARENINRCYPQSGATPGEVLEALHELRPWLDQMEMHLMVARRLRGLSERALAEATTAAEDVWDSAARGKGGSVRDAGPRERYAHFNLVAVEERRAEREAKALHSLTSETEDSIRGLLRGAESIRHDLHLMVRAAQFESNLER